jgi:putative ABC transport system permease protein
MAANIEPDVDQARRQRLIIFIILLIVPAINLSSMTQSRLRQRVAEIGVRRAFGSTRLELMGLAGVFVQSRALKMGRE